MSSIFLGYICLYFDNNLHKPYTQDYNSQNLPYRLGEVCKHVGALLYYIALEVRGGRNKSCSSKPQAWNKPSEKSLKKYTAKPMETIRIQKAKAKSVTLLNSRGVKSVRSGWDPQSLADREPMKLNPEDVQKLDIASNSNCCLLLHCDNPRPILSNPDLFCSWKSNYQWGSNSFPQKCYGTGQGDYNRIFQSVSGGQVFCFFRNDSYALKSCYISYLTLDQVKLFMRQFFCVKMFLSGKTVLTLLSSFCNPLKVLTKFIYLFCFTTHFLVWLFNLITIIILVYPMNHPAVFLK